jgi:hypothetical protein
VLKGGKGINIRGLTTGLFEQNDKNKLVHEFHFAWAAFPEGSDYFVPDYKLFIFNFRVENLELLLAELKKEGVEIASEIETYHYVKLGWIIDPEGNKIKLWEPDDKVIGKRINWIQKYSGFMLNTLRNLFIILFNSNSNVV